MEIVYTLEELPDVARMIIANAEHHHLLFYGDMGVGKTTLIKALVKQLGSEDAVSSPTFSIVNEYLNKQDEPIFHFDFYRIKDDFEAEELGLEEYYSAAAWTFIEWPENINKLLPRPMHTAKIKSLNSNKRHLIFQ